MMKSCIRNIMILSVSAMVFSCAEDLGNYQYHELSELEIKGPEDKEVLTFDRLVLNPELGENALVDDEYSFEWKAIDRNGTYETTILGTDRKLDYEVRLNPGSYALYFTVTHKATGLYWQCESSLVVSSSMSEGWMVLCSDEGRSRLDMLSVVTGDMYEDVLSENGMPQMAGPRRIQWLSDKSDASSPYYLLTDDGATRLGKDAFEWKQEYLFSYESAESADLRPYSIVPAGFGKVIVSDGKAYHCESGMGIDGLYGSAVNKDFDVSPYVGANVLATQVYAAVFLLYDVDNQRFMSYCPLLVTPDLGALNPLQTMDDMRNLAEGMAPGAGMIGSAFDQWPEGMDCLYMENTRYDPGNAKMGMTYALLSDGDDVLLYGVQMGDILRYADCTYVIGKGYYGDLTGCTDVAEPGNLYAFSSLKSYMYYVSGETLYRIDLSKTPLVSEVQQTFPGERITCLKFNLYQKEENMSRSYDLIVASMRNGNGVLRIYEGQQSDGDFSKVTPEVYEGFAEIVDVTYKERIY